MTTTRLYLIRHGATASNEMHPYVLQGAGIDHSLSPTGCKQAVALGEFMKPVQLDAVFASPMKRAVETAEQLTAGRELAIKTFSDLKEVDVGQWEGKGWLEIEAANPTECAAFMKDPWTNPYLGGESYGDVYRRTEPVLMQLVKDHPGKTIAVVAHQVVNRSFIAAAMNVERHQARRIRQSNTAINVFDYTHSDGDLMAVTVNGDFHLREINAVN